LNTGSRLASIPTPCADGNRTGVDHRVVDEKGMRLAEDPSAVDDMASDTKTVMSPCFSILNIVASL
jgi:hypothetical protein